MGKVFSSLLWSFAFIVYVVWIFVTTDGSERIQRACKPIEWTGNVATSLTYLTVPAWEMKTDKIFKKATYGCQFTIWQLFYEKDFIAKMEAIKKQEEEKNKKPKQQVVD